MIITTMTIVILNVSKRKGF